MSKKAVRTLYEPSEVEAEKLSVNRAGKLTGGQRVPILIAAIVSTVGMACPLTLMLTAGTGLLTGVTLVSGLAAWLTWGLITLLTVLSLIFLIGVLWVNMSMFLPEAVRWNAVTWERGTLKLRMAERERPEMPYSYILGKYTFAPFAAPYEVPLELEREYIVYYTPRSRVLLSIAPADQPNSDEWLPKS